MVSLCCAVPYRLTFGMVSRGVDLVLSIIEVMGLGLVQHRAGYSGLQGGWA